MFKSSSITRSVRIPSDNVSSIAVPLGSVAVPTPVKATITISLPTDQSIVLDGVILVSDSATIPFWPFTDFIWMRCMLKLNARDGPTMASHRP